MLLERITKIFRGRSRPMKSALKMKGQISMDASKRMQTPNPYQNSQIFNEINYNALIKQNNCSTRKLISSKSNKMSKDKFFINNDILNDRVNIEDPCVSIYKDYEREKAYTDFNNTGQSHLIIKKIVTINNDIYTASIFRMPQ